MHHIGGQVVEQHGVVALEEVAPVEQQALHKLPVHHDTPIGLQFRAWQLRHKCVEH